MSKDFYFSLYERYLEEGYEHDEADKLTQKNYENELLRYADYLRAEAKDKRLQENNNE